MSLLTVVEEIRKELPSNDVYHGDVKVLDVCTCQGTILLQAGAGHWFKMTRPLKKIDRKQLKLRGRWLIY